MTESKNVLAVTDADFANNVLQSPQLAIVDFWAEWCGPCRMLSPVLDTIADEMTDQVKIFKMNVDESPATPTQYHVRGIPMLIFFKNGQMVDQLVGNQPKSAILDTIKRHLGNA